MKIERNKKNMYDIKGLTEEQYYIIKDVLHEFINKFEEKIEIIDDINQPYKQLTEEISKRFNVSTKKQLIEKRPEYVKALKECKELYKPLKFLTIEKNGEFTIEGLNKEEITLIKNCIKGKIEILWKRVQLINKSDYEGAPRTGFMQLFGTTKLENLILIRDNAVQEASYLEEFLKQLK